MWRTHPMRVLALSLRLTLHAHTLTCVNIIYQHIKLRMLFTLHALESFPTSSKHLSPSIPMFLPSPRPTCAGMTCRTARAWPPTPHAKCAVGTSWGLAGWASRARHFTYHIGMCDMPRERERERERESQSPCVLANICLCLVYLTSRFGEQLLAQRIRTGFAMCVCK